MVGGERTTCASTASSLKLRRANARRPLTHCRKGLLLCVARSILPSGNIGQMLLQLIWPVNWFVPLATTIPRCSNPDAGGVFEGSCRTSHAYESAAKHAEA